MPDSVLNLNLWVIPGQIVANTVIDSGIPFFYHHQGPPLLQESFPDHV